jgi:hypothetical protein
MRRVLTFGAAIVLVSAAPAATASEKIIETNVTNNI